MSVANTDVPVAVRPLGPDGDEDCPIREVLDRVSDKWSVLVIVLLGRRPHRFNKLHRAVDGISQRMLTLRNLARDGLLSRTVYAWPSQSLLTCRPTGFLALTWHFRIPTRYHRFPRRRSRAR
jgi:hypothetical protein